MFSNLLTQETATAEEFVRAFAVEFPSTNVKRALSLCEDGTLAWDRVSELFAKSLSTGLEAVK